MLQSSSKNPVSTTKAKPLTSRANDKNAAEARRDKTKIGASKSPTQIKEIKLFDTKDDRKTMEHSLGNIF